MKSLHLLSIICSTPDLTLLAVSSPHNSFLSFPLLTFPNCHMILTVWNILPFTVVYLSPSLYYFSFYLSVLNTQNYFTTSILSPVITISHLSSTSTLTLYEYPKLTSSISFLSNTITLVFPAFTLSFLLLHTL